MRNYRQRSEEHCHEVILKNLEDYIQMLPKVSNLFLFYIQHLWSVVSQGQCDCNHNNAFIIASTFYPLIDHPSAMQILIDRLIDELFLGFGSDPFNLPPTTRGTICHITWTRARTRTHTRCCTRSRLRLSGNHSNEVSALPVDFIADPFHAVDNVH